MNIVSRFIAAGALVAAASLATPAVAQYACPGGYVYQGGYGCVPAAPGYGAYYGPPAPIYQAPVYQPPVYDVFSLGFFGGDDRHYDRGHDWHGRGHEYHGEHSGGGDDHGHH